MARLLENPYMQYFTSEKQMRISLKSTFRGAINSMMVAAAYKMRHWMNKNAFASFVSWLKTLVAPLANMVFENEKQNVRLHPTLATVA